jgi:GntR family galactonate operon transcriptional repressor
MADQTNQTPLTDEDGAPTALGGGKRVSGDLPGRIAAEFGRRIVSGVIAPGETLPIEPEIQREFAVSRTAVREAMRLLAGKGMTRSRRTTGTYVRPIAEWNMLDPDVLRWHLEPQPSAEFIHNLFEMRLIFEPIAAALAAQRVDDDGRARLRQAAEGIAANPRGSDGQVEADLNFHMTVLHATRNTLLLSLGSLIRSALAVTFQIGWRRLTSPEESVAMHRDVCEKICAGQADEAEALMRALIESARNDSIANFGQPPAGRAPREASSASGE